MTDLNGSVTEAHVRAELRSVQQAMSPANCWHFDSLYDSEPTYIQLGILAEHLMERYSAGSVNEFDRVMAKVELLLASADLNATRLITVGLLEGVQNIGLNQGHALDPLAQRLGPLTRGAWDDVIRFWNQSLPNLQ